MQEKYFSFYSSVSFLMHHREFYLLYDVALPWFRDIAMWTHVIAAQGSTPAPGHWPGPASTHAQTPARVRESMPGRL